MLHITLYMLTTTRCIDNYIFFVGGEFLSRVQNIQGRYELHNLLFPAYLEYVHLARDLYICAINNDSFVTVS